MSRHDDSGDWAFVIIGFLALVSILTLMFVAVIKSDQAADRRQDAYIACLKKDGKYVQDYETDKWSCVYLKEGK